MADTNIYIKEDFYPRPRVEGDNFPCLPVRYSTYFYPRPRVEGDNPKLDRWQQQTNFYPRPRVEGDKNTSLDHYHITISTHALA